MIHNLAVRMAAVFVAHGESSSDDADIYAYACEKIVSTLVNVIIGMATAFLFGRLVEGIVFITGFAMLRKYTGGYHAKTHFNCILTFNIILACVMVLLLLFDGFQVGNIVAAVIANVSLIGIFALAPINQESKRLDKVSYTSLKKKCRWLVFGLWMLCVVDLFTLNFGLGFILALSMFSVLCSMAYANINTKYL